jgi:hypothetical protein
MKIYQAVQKLLVEDTQTADLISLLSFLESSRLKKGCPHSEKTLFYCFTTKHYNP